jgi:hypothetical protein
MHRVASHHPEPAWNIPPDPARSSHITVNLTRYYTASILPYEPQGSDYCAELQACPAFTSPSVTSATHPSIVSPERLLTLMPSVLPAAASRRCDPAMRANSSTVPIGMCSTHPGDASQSVPTYNLAYIDKDSETFTQS